MQYYYPSQTLPNETADFILPQTLPGGSFSYGGKWTITDENAVAGGNATLVYEFNASHVYIILRPPDGKTGTVDVELDGKPVDPVVAGTDVKNGTITITADKLYNILNFDGKPQNHFLKLIFTTPGVSAYTFTFG